MTLIYSPLADWFGSSAHFYIIIICILIRGLRRVIAYRSHYSCILFHMDLLPHKLFPLFLNMALFMLCILFIYVSKNPSILLFMVFMNTLHVSFFAVFYEYHPCESTELWYYKKLILGLILQLKYCDCYTEFVNFLF